MVYDESEEVRRTFHLFEECYEDEASEIPDSRNDCSSHNDRTIIEALRLGGLTGVPQGLYPASIVMDIWDRRARAYSPTEIVPQEFQQYLIDLGLVRQRVKGSKIQIPSLFLAGREWDTIGIILFDTGTGDYYDLFAIDHRMPKESYIQKIPELSDKRKQKLIERQGDFVIGRYFTEQEGHPLTKEVKSRVIYVDQELNTKRTSLEIECLSTNSLSPHFDFLDVIGEALGIDSWEKDWFKRKHSIDEFTPEQQEIIKKTTERYKQSLTTKLKEQLILIDTIKRHFLQRPEFIFVTLDHVVLGMEQ